MEASVYENCPCGQEKRRLLDIVRNTAVGNVVVYPAQKVVAGYIMLELLVDGLDA